MLDLARFDSGAADIELVVRTPIEMDPVVDYGDTVTGPRDATSAASWQQL